MGGGHSCDPQRPAEEWTDDHGMWGKMTAKKRGLAMQKESPNGGANQRLAGSEQWVVLTSALGKEVAKEEASAGITLFIGEGEREEAAPVPHVGVRMPAACRTGWTTVRRRVLCPGSLTGQPWLVFSNPARARMGVGCNVHQSGSLTIGFLFFQLNKIYKL
jgi:hypothetical protein